MPSFLNKTQSEAHEYDDETFRQHSKGSYDSNSGGSSSSNKTSSFLNKMRELKLSGEPAKKKKKKKDGGSTISERIMTACDKKKESALKSKYDESGMKASMQDQYGKEKGKNIYFAKIRKEAMGGKCNEEFDTLEERKLSKTERREGSPAKKSGRAKKLSLVDLDANAMTPKKKGVEAEIEVRSHPEGKVVKKLNPQQFNHYEVKSDEKGNPTEKPDFRQFRSSKVFKDTLKGNKKVRNLHRGTEAHGLTARGGMDKNREVVSHVKASGFNKKHGVNFKGVHFTGDVPGKGTDDKKMKVIKNVIKTKKPKMIKFSDDHAKNLDAPEKFNKTEGKDKNKNRGASTPKIKTYLTRTDGKPVRYGSGGGGVRGRSSDVSPKPSTKETQRRRKSARSWGDDYKYSLDYVYDFIIDNLVSENIVQDYDMAYDAIENLDESTLDKLVLESYNYIINLQEENSQMENYPKIDYKSPYKKLSQKRDILEKYIGEDKETTPYEYWKEFISDEDDSSSISESVDLTESTEEEVSEDEALTSYQKWKAYLENN
jgi:hypothetical protein